MKVAVYANAHNEAHNVDAWVASCKGADYIVVADSSTSTDDTVEKFRAHGIEPYRVNVMPFRSDTVKNTVLSLVPADADICVPLDLDERLMPGWREALEAAWVLGETTMAFHTYVFNHHPDGSPDLTFMQNRIHARHGYIWRYPAHEGLYPYGIVHRTVVIPDLVIEQWQTDKAERADVLAALEWGVAEHPMDARMAHYYGRELMYRGRFREAVAHLERYIMLRPDHLPEQALNAAALAQCYEALHRGEG